MDRARFQDWVSSIDELTAAQRREAAVRCGFATKCLDSYLRWFHLVVLGRHPSPRACLAVASVRTCLRFTN